MALKRAVTRINPLPPSHNCQSKTVPQRHLLLVLLPSLSLLPRPSVSLSLPAQKPPASPLRRPPSRRRPPTRTARPPPAPLCSGSLSARNQRHADRLWRSRILPLYVIVAVIAVVSLDLLPLWPLVGMYRGVTVCAGGGRGQEEAHIRSRPREMRFLPKDSVPHGAASPARATPSAVTPVLQERLSADDLGVFHKVVAFLLQRNQLKTKADTLLQTCLKCLECGTTLSLGSYASLGGKVSVQRCRLPARPLAACILDAATAVACFTYKSCRFTASLTSSSCSKPRATTAKASARSSTKTSG